MSEERDHRYLAYILESLELIERWTASGRDSFLTDDLVQNATLYRLETLAEATSKLSPGLRERHPHIGWRDVTDFRNRVSHGYIDLDLDRVWRVIEMELPTLKRSIQQELDRPG